MSDRRTKADLEEIKEVSSLLKKLNKSQKNTVLATIRGAVLIADSEKEDTNDSTESG